MDISQALLVNILRRDSGHIMPLQQRRSGLKVYILICVTLLCLLPNRGRGEKPYDVDADWSSGFAAQGKGGCTFAKKATYKPLPECRPPDQPIDRAEAVKMGPRFAPILYQHPLDDSWLTDPADWYRQATIFDTSSWRVVTNLTVPEGAGPQQYDYLISQKLFASRLVTPYFNQTNQELSFRVDDTPTLEEKAVINPVVNGRLTGKVWYTAFRPHNASTGEIIPYSYVFTYFFFYPWNGCSNQAIATQVGGKRQGVEYYMCGDGAHEGDLEHVKVFVCEADMKNEDPSTAVYRAQYSQHSWLPDLDCKAGECAFENDDRGVRRLVTHAALFSHANWPFETPLFVYKKIKLPMLLNMDGFYIGDRYKRGPVWYPRENNCLWLPFLSELANMSRPRVDNRWITFPGVWGGTLSTSGRRTLTCLVDNHTAIAPCPERNPAYYFLNMALKPGSWRKEDMVYKASPSGNTVSGPLWNRPAALNWEIESQAPLYDGMADVLPMLGDLGETVFDYKCPFEDDLKTSDGSYDIWQGSSIESYMYGVLGLVLGSAVVTMAMVLPILLMREDLLVLEQLTAEQPTPQNQGQDQVAAPPPPAPVAEGIETEATTTPRGTAVLPYGSLAVAPAALTPAQVASHPSGDSGSSGSYLAPKPATPPAASSTEGRGDGGKGAAERSKPSNPWLSAQRLSHQIVLRVFHATVLQPYILTVWVFVGVSLYIIGLVLGSIGLADMVEGLHRIQDLPIWDILSTVVIIAFAVFGAIHLAIIIASLYVRPSFGKWFGCQARGLQAARRSWRAHAVLAGLLVIEMNVTMLLFALGLMMWVSRYALEQACGIAISLIFEIVDFISDVCIDLSSVGIDQKVCGSDLANLCGIWSDLHVDYISFGALLFLSAQCMFLVLATTNYVGMRTSHAVDRAMQLALDPDGEKQERKCGGGLPDSCSALWGTISCAGLRRRKRAAETSEATFTAVHEVPSLEDGAGTGTAALTGAGARPPGAPTAGLDGAAVISMTGGVAGSRDGQAGGAARARMAPSPYDMHA